jgi:hypothetical protein
VPQGGGVAELPGERAVRRSQAQDHPAYDFGWMWEALKITDLRQ